MKEVLFGKIKGPAIAEPLITRFAKRLFSKLHFLQVVVTSNRAQFAALDVCATRYISRTHDFASDSIEILFTKIIGGPISIGDGQI